MNKDELDAKLDGLSANELRTLASLAMNKAYRIDPPPSMPKKHSDFFDTLTYLLIEHNVSSLYNADIKFGSGSDSIRYTDVHASVLYRRERGETYKPVGQWHCKGAFNDVLYHSK